MYAQALSLTAAMSWTPETGVYMDSHYNLVYPKGATHLDAVDKETMEVIHDHWGSFPPQHPLVASIVGISFFVLWIINLFGNGSVCYIFLKVKSLRTPSNLFVVNLAFSDLCMMTTMGLPVVINAFTQRYWMWGAFGTDKIFFFFEIRSQTQLIFTKTLLCKKKVSYWKKSAILKI